MTSADLETDAARLRELLASSVAGSAGDDGWRKAAAAVPRHLFTPGFYLPGERDADGLTVWEPVTADRDYGRWLTAAYSDTTLITQFDDHEPDWTTALPRHGGAPSSSSTLPSLVLRMWADADIRDGHDLLEIGTGTGYSTALACERLGSEAVTSIEVDPHRLASAADALGAAGYAPALAVADGLYGYWPRAPFDRVAAACSFRTVPPALLAQTRPGGKVLLTLSGWLYGYARVLLTVADDGTAHGAFLDGTVSFMSARTHAAPAFGNPSAWAGLAGTGEPRPARHAPARLEEPTAEAFHLRFLAQCAVPTAQMLALGDTVHLVDTVTGSAALLTADGGGWTVREAGPVALWRAVEDVADAFDAAGRPDPAAFRLTVDADGQRVTHPALPALALPVP